MTKARILADFISDGSSLADGTISVAEVSGAAPLASPTFTGTVVATSLDISGDIDVDGTTNLDVVDIDGAVDMASTLAVGGVVTANAGVVVDNITIDGTTIALSSGDLTLDVAGDINLDADGADINLKDGGTRFGILYNSASNFHIEASVQDKDIKFLGNDGGSGITALTLDMSSAGAATFNTSVLLSGTGGLTTTGGNNLTVSGSVLNHAGLIFATQAILPAQEGAEAAANVIDIGANGNEFKSLYLNTSIINDAGFTLDSGGDIILDAGGSDILLKVSGTTFGSLRENSSNFRIKSDVLDKDMLFLGNDGGVEITALTLDMSEAGNATFNGKIVATELDCNGNADVSGTLGVSGTSTFTDILTRSGEASSASVYVDGTVMPYMAAFYNATTGATNSPAGIQFQTRSGDNTAGSWQTGIVAHSGGPYANYIIQAGTSEKLRIDTSGVLTVGNSSFQNASCTAQLRGAAQGATDEPIASSVSSTVASFQYAVYNSNGRVGSITTNASTTAFNTSSDERLKENIVDAADAGALIDAIKVRQFDWKVDALHQDYGMIAQELQTVVPAAVHTPADETEMMSVDYSKLVPLLVKEIQSLRDRLSVLEGE
jgi:cytoskeletal protein CcmA (bactofilin family)